MTERGNFGSKLGIVLATAGSAVGLGNIWRFPYMTGQNGGAAFLLMYVACILLLGVPGMISEFIVGRNAQTNAASNFFSEYFFIQFLNPFCKSWKILSISKSACHQAI